MNSLLNAVHIACYTAKNKGRTWVHVYQADNREVVKAKSEMQSSHMLSTFRVPQ
ncbi:MAG: hypothetical protein KME29_26505 [Calothrix sp. FI2-JRJ7]|jgi:hypothetical protein|nr:hypothetical protein [Calothrix sp. FI2-JRJ7]